MHTDTEKQMLVRASALIGEQAMERISDARVIIFGIGGVGSWCAESLIRSGIKHLTMVDSDEVCMSNCNRQMMACPATVGQLKVEAMRDKLLGINPDAEIVALTTRYNQETSASFQLQSYDYVIDAIDSLKDKVHLILTATALSRSIRRGELSGEGVARSLTFFSSMGAALRTDPTKVTVAEFWNVRNDTLGKALRKHMRHNKVEPACKFRCVYSEELPRELNGGEKGSISHVTGIFGLTLAGLVLENIVENVKFVEMCPHHDEDSHE